MSTVTETTLAELLTFRQSFESTLRARIAEVSAEREAMIAEYDNQIDELREQLALLGLNLDHPVGDGKPNALARSIFDFLASYPGQLFSSHELKRRFRTDGVMPIILSPYIQTKSIELVGKSYRYVATEQNT